MRLGCLGYSILEARMRAQNLYGSLGAGELGPLRTCSMSLLGHDKSRLRHVLQKAVEAHIPEQVTHVLQNIADGSFKDFARNAKTKGRKQCFCPDKCYG